MSAKDIREWIKEIDALGELKRVENADWNLEIGTLVDLYQSEMGLPAMLFDNIKGYPPGYRILANSLTSIKRIAHTFGLSPDAGAMDLVEHWLEYSRNPKLIPPKTVESGPVFENIQEGDEIDLLKFPSPIWHELDGGRFFRYRMPGDYEGSGHRFCQPGGISGSGI